MYSQQDRRCPEDHKVRCDLKINELVKQGVVIKKQSEKDKRVYILGVKPHMEQF